MDRAKLAVSYCFQYLLQAKIRTAAGGILILIINCRYESGINLLM